MKNTYSTSDVAKLIGIHPNTVRLYEDLGLITRPERKEITEEYTKVLEQKKEWYREYREVRSEMKKFQLAQEITRTFLNEEQQMPKRGLIER